MRDQGRTNHPTSLSSFLDGERSRILQDASPERRAEMAQAERSREVYRAWNAVCGGTREGEHVTGLRYLPESNELLVYLDESSWTQEMTMLREIIRARMAIEGVDLAGFKFRTSKAGYHAAKSTRRRASVARAKERIVGNDERPDAPRAPRAPLTDDEERELDHAVAPIGDERLAQALKNAMKASAEWKKGQNAQNKA